jgi:NADPH-dependent 2,4-dienoyl-CoA reductase/sulfur reductase-like enzyme
MDHPGDTIVVVGGNAAGLTAASRARRLDPRLRITVLERTPSAAYSTCGIPYFLAGDVPHESLISMTPAAFLRERDIEVATSVEVDSLLPSRRVVVGHRTDTGESLTFRFDRLLLATGAKAAVPDIPGTDLPGVFSILNLEDALRSRPRLDAARRVGIVGAGYVGVEMAEALRRMGKEVTLYEQRRGVLSALDPDMSRIVEYELERHGVSVRTGARVTSLVGGNNGVEGVRTGGSLGVCPADAVLLDTGVEPNSSLALPAGIHLGASGGIAVDAYMETNLPGIFAAGNCVETVSLLRGRPAPEHLGTVAAKQGRVAGENLAGRRTRYQGSVGTTILRAFDLGIGKTGLNAEEAASEQIPHVSARIEALDRAGYFPGARKIWIKLLASRDTGRVLGVQAVGYGDVARRLDVAATAITAGLSTDQLAHLDLAYTPPFGSLWDPLHVAAQAVLRKL